MKILALALLAIPIWAQCPSFAPVDQFVTMNGQSVGTAVSTTNLTAGTEGSTHAWSRAASQDKFGVSQVTLPATVTVNGGATHLCNSATQSLQHDNSTNQNNGGFGNLTPASGHNIIVVSGWLANLPPNQGGSGSLWDLVKLDTGAGAEAILQLVSGTDQPQSNCAAYGIEIEKTSGGTGHSACITVSPGGTYYYSFKVDFSANSLASLALYTVSGTTFTQVGSTVTRTLSTTGAITTIFFGNAEFGTAPGTFMYFQNMMVDWTNAVFPNLPTGVFHVAKTGNDSTGDGSAGNPWLTIQHCATAMANGNTCVVHVGSYAENVNIPAGGVGAYKTITVNGSDVVTVQGFTANSHTKIIGNCSAPAAINTCGFSITNPSAPASARCVDTPASATDVFIDNNVAYACGSYSMIGMGSANGTGVTNVYIQGNTLSYACITQAQAGTATKECNGIVLHGNNILVEGNDVSHYTLGIHFNDVNFSVFRNNTVHDQYETEAGGNAHTDTFYVEPTLTTGHVLIEGNTLYNGIGPNAKVWLTQGQDAGCNATCLNGIIFRYNVAHDFQGLSLSGFATQNDKLYNNTYANIGTTCTSCGDGEDQFHSTQGASTGGTAINEVWYKSTALAGVNDGFACVSAFDSGSAPTGTWGHSLAYVNANGAPPIWGKICGTGAWTDGTGNILGYANKSPATNNPNFANLAANDFHLGAGSPALAAGTSITTTTGTGNSTTALTVADAYMLSDGYGVAQPDWIRIGGANGTVVQLAAWSACGNASCINYGTNTVTLASPVSWSAGQAVDLYKKSDGVAVLSVGATAPDMGALPSLSSVVLSNNPTSIAFGNVQSGQTGTPTTVTVSNVGSANAAAITCALTGTNANQFSLSGACPGSLAFGANFTQTVNCAPTGAGSFSANLTINDPTDGVSSSTTLSCTGISQAPNLVNAPTAIAFGNQPTSTSSATQTVTITNNGTGLATISSCALTGTNANQFTLTGVCAGTVAVNANFTQTVAFSPTTVGAKSAALTITYDAGATSVTTLTGTGITTAPNFNLTASSACGASNLNVQVSCPALTLTNSGNASGTVSTIAFSGANPTSFTYTATAPCNSLPATLAASGTCTITPKMTPLSAGALAATLTVTDTPDTLTAISAISGTGVDPNVWSKVQVASCGPKSFPSGTGSTCTITPNGAGNLIVPVIDTGVGFQPASITIVDDQGNTYVPAVDGNSNPIACLDSNTGSKALMYYSANSTAGATTLTIIPATTGTLAVNIYEFHGPTAQDTGASGVLNSQAATTTPVAPTVNTTSSQEVIVAAASVQQRVTSIFAGNPFTNDSLIFGNGWASLITSSTGAYQAKWSAQSGTYCSIAASFNMPPPSVNTPGEVSVSGALLNGVIAH